MRALERTGEARGSAEDAGIDHTTAYARRRTHADFAERRDAELAAEGWSYDEERDHMVPPG